MKKRVKNRRNIHQIGKWLDWVYSVYRTHHISNLCSFFRFCSYFIVVFASSRWLQLKAFFNAIFFVFCRCAFYFISIWFVFWSFFRLLDGYILLVYASIYTYIYVSMHCVKFSLFGALSCPAPPPVKWAKPNNINNENNVCSDQHAQTHSQLVLKYKNTVVRLSYPSVHILVLGTYTQHKLYNIMLRCRWAACCLFLVHWKIIAIICHPSRLFYLFHALFDFFFCLFGLRCGYVCMCQCVYFLLFFCFIRLTIFYY